MVRHTIPVVLRKDLIEQLELLAKKQGISRSRLIENIIEHYFLNQQNFKPKTFKEKVLKWLMTGEEE
jgi:metal-responsive CopG/Arc/MetJ family transcriptional regulator